AVDWRANRLVDKLAEIAVGAQADSKSVVDLVRSLDSAVAHAAALLGLRDATLLQATWHNRSLCLYTKLGFDTRALLSNIQGQPLNLTSPGCSVRLATAVDLAACDVLCVQVHGHDRHGELADAVAQGTATAVEQQGRIVGYASSVGYLGHAVAEHDDALKALVGEAPSFFGPGFILPTTNGDVLRWCLSNGLRLVQPFTLMSIGEYQEPAGPYMSSILY
ncbi:MAG: hypothetical protein OSB03_15350, partial [Vicinamibacterales bacterium]|nr:hypothetical protein [Vicinamibacterales bacterium]